jgi:hypothetical protein
MRDGMKSYNQVRKVGIESLAQALGPVGMARFLQQFDMGSGDYTKERHKWLGWDER